MSVHDVALLPTGDMPVALLLQLLQLLPPLACNLTHHRPEPWDEPPACNARGVHRNGDGQAWTPYRMRSKRA